LGQAEAEAGSITTARGHHGNLQVPFGTTAGVEMAKENENQQDKQDQNKKMAKSKDLGTVSRTRTRKAATLELAMSAPVDRLMELVLSE
jgi:hypothetical protein